MTVVSDTIYHLEITEDPDDLELTQYQCLKTAEHLIKNLNYNHSLPGKDFQQILGILDWNREHGFITPKQHYYLIMILWEYIDQRQHTPMEML
jgi:hypothetical protein